MATVEYLKNRVDGKVREIAKLSAKIERIRKAEATNWTVNPYYYHESDLKWALKDLEAAQKSLEKYTNDLKVAEQKSNSRNIKAIIDFLDGWKNRVRTYYTEQFPKYIDAKQAHAERGHELTNAMCRGTVEERKAAREEYNRELKHFMERWNWITPYEDRRLNAEKTFYVPFFDIDKLNKELDEEANRKYDFIIERTNEIVGTITDASGLSVGAKGDLNGLIYGENGVAKVTTIGAGGYNIQCYHFRTLIHKAA